MKASRRTQGQTTCTVLLGLALTMNIAMAAAQETDYTLVDLESTWTAEDVERELGDRAQRLRVDEAGETMSFFTRMADAESVYIGGTIQKTMHRIGETDLWGLAVKVPGLGKAVVGYYFVGFDANRQMLNPEASVLNWRGSKAPTKPPSTAADALKGQISTHAQPYDRGDRIEQRDISVYLPPSHDPSLSYPVIFMGDGLGIAGYAGVVEPLIESGVIAPLVMVGIHSGVYEGDPAATRDAAQDRRTIEYLYGITEYIEGADPQAYETHERFVLDVVMPWAEQTWGAAQDRARRCIYGSSNGGSLAVSMTQRHPEVFAYVAPFSAAFLGAILEEPWIDKPALEYFIVVGAYEGNFKESTDQLVKTLNERESKHDLTVRFSGHDSTMWNESFVDLVKWLDDKFDRE